VKLIEVEPFDRETLLSTLRRVKLVGHGQIEVYRDADITLVPALDTDALTPAQYYALDPTIEHITLLREALLAEGHDIFALDGGLWVRTSRDPGKRFPIIPPVAEEGVTRGGREVLLVNDGIHRVATARSLGAPISTVVVRGAPKKFPYYAFPLENGWDGVTRIRELEPGFVKKDYVTKDGYKQLFRDFDALFPGVQPLREETNPPDFTR
jgi:hypothetical protein